MIRTASAALLAASALIGSHSTAVAVADDEPRPPTGGTTSPYAQWNVEVRPHGDDPGVVDLVFDSPLLHERITNRVYLPGNYRAVGEPAPVLYYLHGTILPPLDNHLLSPVTDRESLLTALGPGGGARQTDIFRFETQRSTAKFLVVAPDTGPRSICQSCVWVDGRDDPVPNLPPLTAHTIPADRFLHEELYPLVQAVFNVRSDRAGRGIMGFSMGGTSAYLQAMLHPDDYALAASISGPLDVVDDLPARAIWEGFGFMRDQGYGTALTNPIDWRGHNPADLASNLEGVDLPVLSSAGDACLALGSLLTEDCRRVPPITNPAAAAGEVVMANNYRVTSSVLESHGVNETRVQVPGVHGANNHRVFGDHVVPWANSIFDRQVTDPTRFQFRTTAPSFTVWDYAISTTRDHSDFTEVSNATLDGRQFTIRGTGSAEIRTPARFETGRTYTVEITDSQRARSIRPVIADPEGRLSISVRGSDPGFDVQVVVQDG